MYALRLPSPTCLALVATRIQLRLSRALVWAHVCLPFNGAHASVTTSLTGRETPFRMFLADRKDYFTRLLDLPRFGGTLFLTWATTLLSYTVTAESSSSGRFCFFFPSREYPDLAHCDHCYSSKTARSRRLYSQPTQWKRYVTRPTALNNVAALQRDNIVY